MATGALLLGEELARQPCTSEASPSQTASPLKEPFVGNVSKCVPLPPEHSGAVQRGQLQFDACFETGNLGRVDWISNYEYDLFIRPDTCNPRFRVWFNFTVQNVQSEQRIIFNIVNYSKTKSLFRDGMSPLIKSTSRPTWQRIPEKNVFYYRCPDHQKNYVLSFAFAFDREDDVYQFAYSYPYSYTRLQDYLERVETLSLDYLKRELLCHSVQQRRLDLLTITSPENLARAPGTRSRMVFVTCRVHPGESPASYVCQGHFYTSSPTGTKSSDLDKEMAALHRDLSLMEYLLSDDPGAKVLRDNIIFKIVPMLNPDGVYLGNYRCSLMGFDLNRHWQEPSPWAHPTLHTTKQLVMQYDKDPSIDLDFYIDIHAHSTLTNGFMYGNVYEDEERFERQAIFPKLLAKLAEDFSWNKTSFNKDVVKAGTGRRFLGGCLHPQTHCYTLEVSFFSYTTLDSSTHAPYTEEAYQSLGRNVAKAFLDYYNLQH